MSMGSFIMSGRLQAIGFTVLFALLSILMPPFSLLSNAAIALVSLRQGWYQGVILSVIASLAIAITSMFLQQPFLVGLQTGLMQWLPMVLFAAILMRTVSWTYTLQIMLFVCVGGILLFHSVVDDPLTFWKAILEPFLNTLAEANQLSDKDTAQLLTLASTWATGFIAAALAATWIISLLIARHWQAILYNPGGFGEEFRNFRVGQIPALIVIVVVAALFFTDSQILGEIALVSMLVFMFQGLGIMHALVHKFEMSLGWLVGLYILMIIATRPMIVLLASFGVIDNFTDIRNRLSTRKD